MLDWIQLWLIFPNASEPRKIIEGALPDVFTLDSQTKQASKAVFSNSAKHKVVIFQPGLTVISSEWHVMLPWCTTPDGLLSLNNT